MCMETIHKKGELSRCGVYSIRNCITQKEYIGSTTQRFDKRLREHVCQLNKNRHDSPKLQHSWNKYGEQCFVFSVLEICHPTECVNHEQKWINKQLPHIKGYNICGTAGNCLGRKFSAESKKKMSISHIGIFPSKETRKKMSVTRKRKLSDIRMKLGYIPGHSVTQKTKKKLSINNARFWEGKPRSVADRKKMSIPKTFIGGISPLSKPVIALCNKTYEFASIHQASKSPVFDKPINPGHIVDCCKGTHKHAGKINGIRVAWKYKT